MNNDPELSGRYLGTISRDFVLVADTIKEASYQVRVRNISKYPIFPISKTDIAIGKLLIGRKELALEWNYYISFLDEFIQRTLVSEDMLPEFEAAYKNPDEYCCLFVIDEEFTNFVFIPYPED
ncbi:hypothetical protein [Sporocytophaga myxococcoides]|uniref:hypothetical protein n=1 Tax=Sporocytophaga myxococcoides TaxID=153721 RepID=UPI000426C497|nr:hypothetical protein [Sporocytophaga myxococcoides]